MRWLTPRLHRFAMTHPDIDVRASLDSPPRPESIDSHQLLHDDRGLMYEQQSYWELWLKAQNISKIDPGAGIHFSHSILALQAAADGFGITVSSPALARDDLRTGRLVQPFPLEIALQSSYSLVSNEVAAGREAVRVFSAWAAAEAEAERAEHARVGDVRVNR